MTRDFKSIGSYTTNLEHRDESGRRICQKERNRKAFNIQELAEESI